MFMDRTITISDYACMYIGYVDSTRQATINVFMMYYHAAMTVNFKSSVTHLRFDVLSVVYNLFNLYYLVRRFLSFQIIKIKILKP